MDFAFQLLLLLIIISLISTDSSANTAEERERIYATRRLARDLHKGKRFVLAMGTIAPATSITIFTSAILFTSHSDFAEGYRVDLLASDQATEDEPKDGRFLLDSSTLAPLNSSFNSASEVPDIADQLLFLVTEGQLSAVKTSLLVLSGTSASTLKLQSRPVELPADDRPSFKPLPLLQGNSYQLSSCFANGGLHLSSFSGGSGQPLTYYVLYRSDKSGNSIARMKLHGAGEKLSQVDACNTLVSLGRLCVTGGGGTISLSKKEKAECFGAASSVLNRLTAGYVGQKAVWLVDVDGGVHFFDRSLLMNDAGEGGVQTTGFTSVSRKKAWKTWPLQLPQQNASEVESSFVLDPHFNTNIIIAGCTYLLLVFISIGTCLYYYLLKRRQWRLDEEDRKLKANQDLERAKWMLQLRRLKRVPSDSGDDDDSESELQKRKRMAKKNVALPAMNKGGAALKVKSSPAVDIYAVYAANRLQRDKTKLVKGAAADRRSKMLSLGKITKTGASKRKVALSSRKSISKSASSSGKFKRKKGKKSSVSSVKGKHLQSSSGKSSSRRQTIFKGKSTRKSKTRPRRRASSVPPKKSRSSGAKEGGKEGESSLVKSRPYYSFAR